jgi:hypothetical protein
MSDEVEAIGIGGAEIVEVRCCGVRLDRAAWEAAYEEAITAAVPPKWRSAVALHLGAVRTGQRPYMARGEGPLIEAVAGYLVGRGEHGLALAALMHLD